MGPFARKALSEARRFATKAPGEIAQKFGRKITSAAQNYGQTISDFAHGASEHASLAGLDGVSKTLKSVGNTSDHVVSAARLLDQNQPRAATDHILHALGKYY